MAADRSVLSYHRTVEAMKFTYGQRLGLGDPPFNSTVAQVCVPLYVSTVFTPSVSVL